MPQAVASIKVEVGAGVNAAATVETDMIIVVGAEEAEEDTVNIPTVEGRTHKITTMTRVGGTEMTSTMSTHPN